MSSRHALDLRIEIAELFDTGRLIDRVQVDELTNLVNAHQNSATRAILLLDFKTVEKRNRTMQTELSRYAPPRTWPNLTGRSSPLTHSIKELFVSERYTGRCSAADLAPLVGASVESVGRSMKALGFKLVKRQHVKHVGWRSAIVEPPRDWPPLFERQRELRRAGLSAGAVTRATDAAADVEDIIKQAVQRLDVSDIPLNQRGMLKRSIKDVIRDVYREATRDSIPRRELARWLGESAEANVAALENRVQGLLRFATRQNTRSIAQEA